MPDSIKLQIMRKIADLLDPLKLSAGVRSITRAVDLAANAATRPALQIFDGPERLMSKDNRGRTYQFEIGIKVLVESQRDIAAEKDRLVPLVQEILESNIQLGGLATILDGGEEIPFIDEVQKPLGGAVVMYTIQYRRILGDPFATY